MKISILPRRIILPPILSDVLRRLAIFQVCITIGFEIIFVLGALSAQKLNGSDRILGVATTTVFAIGQLVIALPVGKWMDKYGRRPVLLTGSVIETGALLIMGAALVGGSSLWFCLGLVMLGLGSGAAQMAFLAGGDIFPPDHRAEGLGHMTTYIAIGIVGGPYLVGLISDLCLRLGWDPVTAPWFCISTVTAVASWLMFGLHPDPLTVARNPKAYYPNAEEPLDGVEDKSTAVRNLGGLLKYYPIFASVGIMVCFQGVRMSLVPLLTYILDARGIALSLASLLVAAMGFGMVLSSSLVGRLGDKWGRKKMLGMAVLIGIISAGFIPLVTSIGLLFILLAALGVAFSTALTMTRVIITDSANTRERGLAMALNSTAIGIAVVLFPTISSYVLSFLGWSAMAWIGIFLMIPALVLVLFLRETSAGKWDHPKKASESG